MLYRIESIEPGVGDTDVLVTVAYWYNRPTPAGPPDFIEDHSIVNMPRYIGTPKMNDLGQYYSAVDGTLVNQWVLDDEGDWTKRVPDPAEVVFEIDPALEAEHSRNMVLNPLGTQAQQVKRLNRRGQDRFTAASRPRPKPGLPVLPDRAADRALIQGLVGIVHEA